VISEENVERWRGLIEDFRVTSSGSSWEGWLDRAAESMDPAIVWDASEQPALDIAGVYRGREAVLQWWREWLAAWETVEFNYELLDAGDRVVLLLDQRMRGRSTDIEVPMGKYAHVAMFKDGLMVHWKHYESQGKALDAAGLSE
jgi:SnoaL-like domain